MKYIKSKYVYEYTNSIGRYTFFNAVNLSLLSAEEEDKLILNSYINPRELKDDDTSRILLANGMIVPEGKEEELDVIKNKKLRYKKAKDFRGNRIGYMRISLTENCNMACKYCFVDKIIDEKSNMSTELFDEAISWFIDNNKNKYLLIQYFGGEPTLRMDLIKRGNEILKKAKYENKISGYWEEIVTNGTLIDDEKINFFIENQIGISFSIDGKKDIHDKNRIFQNGKGTFDTVIASIEKFKEAGGEVSLFITPNEDNIYNFKEIIEYFVEELKADEISVNTPQPYENGWEVEGKDLAIALQSTLRYCSEKGVKYNTPSNNILFLINNKIPQTYSCMNLTYGQNENTWGVYVSSKGKVSKCVVECNEKCTCDFKDFKMDNEFIDWHFQPSLLKECLECPATNVCGGPCSVESLLTNGGRNKSKCAFVRNMMKWVMENE